MQKFNKGDKVKVAYGHIIWTKEPSGMGKYLGKTEFGFCYDIKSDLVEDIATVVERKDKSNRYLLKFDKHGSMSWFNEADIISA